MKKLSYLFILPAFILLSCQKEEKKTVEITEEITKTIEIERDDTIKNQIPIGDTSQNALDWNGTYKGTLPCADCEGIETELTLNLDGNYLYKATYLGKGVKVLKFPPLSNGMRQVP